MVLIKKLFSFLSLSFFSLTLFSQENELSTFWKDILQESLNNSIEIQKIKNDFTSAYIYKKQYDYTYYPYLEFDLPQNIIESKGTNFSVLNQQIFSNNMWILNPSINFSLTQKLPANGKLLLTAGYGINYLVDRSSFLQKPLLQLTYNQSLGNGFFFTKNPETQLINSQYEYSYLYYKNEFFKIFMKIIDLLKNFDILNYQIDYYESIKQQYSSQVKTAEEKKQKGLQSDLQLFYLNYQLLSTNDQLISIHQQKEEIEKELFLLINKEKINTLSDHRSELLDFLLNITEKNKQYMNETNINISLFRNQFLQAEYSFKKDELSYKPILYITSSVATDSNNYYLYSDFYKSIRSLFERPYPINFTGSIGLKMNLELPAAKKLRKDLFIIQRNNITSQIEKTEKINSKSFTLLQEQIKEKKDYFYELNAHLKKEEAFRITRKILFDKNLITQDEYTESETTYYLINRDYITTYWEIITNILKLAEITDIENLILRIFMETK